jgi:hypothetical protein
VNSTDIQAQVGAAQGLWTHTPVDWAGNEGFGTPAGYPANAAQGYLGMGTRPGGAVTQSGPAGAPIITGVQVYGNIGTTTADIIFILNVVPTSCRVNYGTTEAVASNKAGANVSGSQVVNLTGLTSQTTYYLSVQATNASGTTVTTLYSFRTK